MNHELYMLRCLELARLGKGTVSPNPMVGAVLVAEDQIIGEGYHQQFGEGHAEVNAIRSVKKKSLLEKSTIYVSLEPCSHFGKTPPCAELILTSKIPHVVVACLDPNPKVAGNGIELLRNNGVKVTFGILEKEAVQLNERFFINQLKKRPYVILKWAVSEDGFLDRTRVDNGVHQNWITNESSKTLVHQWRKEEDAIVIGVNTAINDDPSLTTRLVYGRNPLRVVIDPNDRLPAECKLLKDENATLIFSNKKEETIGYKKWKKLQSSNPLEVWEEILAELHAKKIGSVFVEGGAFLLNLILESNFWDEIRVGTGKVQFENGLKAPTPKGILNESFKLEEDQWDVYKRKEE